MLLLHQEEAVSRRRRMTLQEENIRLHTRISELERRVDALYDEKYAIETDFELYNELVTGYFAGGKYGRFTGEQIRALGNILKMTPLTLEAAAAVVYYSDRYRLDYALVLSVIETESNFEQYLVGGSGDRGYMQIIPGTEKYLVDVFGEEIGIDYEPGRIFEPDYNLGIGIRYLAYLHRVHGGDMDKILTEYNKGAGGLANHYNAYATYSSNYSRAVIDRREKYREIHDSEEDAD